MSTLPELTDTLRKFVEGTADESVSIGYGRKIPTLAGIAAGLVDKGYVQIVKEYSTMAQAIADASANALPDGSLVRVFGKGLFEARGMNLVQTNFYNVLEYLTNGVDKEERIVVSSTASFFDLFTRRIQIPTQAFHLAFDVNIDVLARLPHKGFHRVEYSVILGVNPDGTTTQSIKQKFFHQVGDDFMNSNYSVGLNIQPTVADGYATFSIGCLIGNIEEKATIVSVKMTKEPDFF